MQHESQTRQRPVGAGLSRKSQDITAENVTTHINGLRGVYGRPQPPTIAPIDLFLPRLENVQIHGKGYRGDCLVGHSSKGTLSVAAGDDGRVILHCFAGCSAAEVVAAAGLELADLFPQRLMPSTPEQRKELGELARQANWRAALNVLDRESAVVLIASGYADRGERLTDEDHARLHEARERIARAREVLCDRR